MLSSINPFVERARNNRWWRTVTAHVAGAAGAGALVGWILGGLGAVALSTIPSTTRLAGAAVLSLVLAGFDLVGRRPPSWHRQVDEGWLTTYRGWVYGFGFGAQLGAGVLTQVTTGAVYAAGGWALAQADPVRGAVVGLLFGSTRGVMVLLGAGAGDPDRLRQLFRRLDRAERISQVATVGALMLVGVGGALVAA